DIRRITPGLTARCAEATSSRVRAARCRAALPSEPHEPLIAAYGSISVSEPLGGDSDTLIVLAPASAGELPTLAGGVYQAAVVIVRLRARSAVVNEVVSGDRLAGELQPPSLPLVGRVGRLISEQEMVPAERTTRLLSDEQTKRVAVQW